MNGAQLVPLTGVFAPGMRATGLPPATVDCEASGRTGRMSTRPWAPGLPPATLPTSVPAGSRNELPPVPPMALT